MIVRTINPVQILEAHQHGIWTLCLSADHHLISGGGDGLLKLWKFDVQTEKLVLLSSASTPHTGILVVQKTKYGKLVSVGHHGGICVWNIEHEKGLLRLHQNLGMETEYWEYNDRILETQTGHLITWIYLGALPPIVWEWSSEEGSYRLKQELPMNHVSVLVEDLYGNLFSGDRDGKITWWWKDITMQFWTAGQTLQAHKGAVRAMTWTREGYLLSGGDDCLIKYWQPNMDFKSLVLMDILEGHSSPIFHIMETKAGEIVSNDHGVRILAFRYRRKPEFRVWRKKPEGIRFVQNQMGFVRGYLPPDLLIIDEMEGSLTLWKRQQENYVRYAIMKNGHRDLIVCFEVLSDGYLATGGLDGRLVLWDIRSFLANEINEVQHESY